MSSPAQLAKSGIDPLARRPGQETQHAVTTESADESNLMDAVKSRERVSAFNTLIRYNLVIARVFVVRDWVVGLSLSSPFRRF